MKKLLLTTGLCLVLSAPVFASASDDYAAESLANRTHDLPANVADTTREILNDGGADLNMPASDADIATRGATGYSIAHQNLAAQLGVSPSEYSLAELAHMMIDLHD